MARTHRLPAAPAVLLAALSAIVGGCATTRPLTPGDPISADRPGFTTGPDLVPAGAVQTEVGASSSRDGRVRTDAVGEMLVRIPAGTRAELRLAANSFEVVSAPGAPRVSGMDDASIGAKLLLLRGADGASGIGRARPTAALLVGTSLPTGGRAFGSSAASPEAIASLGWDLTDALSLTGNGGMSAERADGAWARELSAGASLGYGVSDRVGTYLEYFQAWPQGAPSTARYVNGGVTYLLTSSIQLDGWAAVGAHRGGPDYAVGLGFARRW